MSDSVPLSPLSRPSTNQDQDRPPSVNDHESPPDYESFREPPKELTLHDRSKSALVLALLYAALVLAPWVITCLLANRPITTSGHYGDVDNYNRYDAETTQSPFKKNERWYHAAQVIQAIASVLALPLTSSICASAAVIYMQRNQRLTMPQLMTLADRGWMNRATYWRIWLLQWPQYGSSFLVVALITSLLALIIAPIQSIFLTSEAVKTPTHDQKVGMMWDLPRVIQTYADLSSGDSNINTIITRAALTTASTNQPHAQLWPGANVSCDPLSYEVEGKNICSRQGATFNDMTGYPDPFFAQLPSTFHTGLFRQFLPRFNSSAQVQAIEESEFPANCDRIDNGFFVEYTNSSRYYDTDIMQIWGLKACMPGNVRESPWKATRNRHDFSEELYLDIKLTNWSVGWTSIQERGIYRVTLNTTTGYFELPNYMNGGVAGFLLEKDPIEEPCDDGCKDQTGYYGYKRDITTITPVAPGLQIVGNKGPLLTTALALFGTGSYIETRATNPEIYGATALPDWDSERFNHWPVGSSACIYLSPLDRLTSSNSNFRYCIKNSDGGENGEDIDFQIVNWLENFLVAPASLENAFNAAAYIATKTWLENNPGSSGDISNHLSVSFDLGADSQIPVISLAGLIFVSVLLGIHLLLLLSMGVYAAWSQRWTKQLDSFAMMRIGASISHHVPLLMSYRLNLVKELREVPGWMGDQMPESEKVGVLGLGGPVQLKKGRKYASYHKKPYH
ncbi:hypothetical protein FE257_009961 [Aspergillus nanangensis]|uniref:Uncharacterized protein n=1 Tax=Aspergillus nanangensis TaxID=2582783 RepID=A0AAD4CW48_ASPNN|nr:hypothetical protein FE257_009961 [Aspergillus nanangensis]